jgi:hypothetical protein
MRLSSRLKRKPSPLRWRGLPSSVALPQSLNHPGCPLNGPGNIFHAPNVSLLCHDDTMPRCYSSKRAGGLALHGAWSYHAYAAPSMADRDMIWAAFGLKSRGYPDIGIWTTREHATAQSLPDQCAEQVERIADLRISGRELHPFTQTRWYSIVISAACSKQAYGISIRVYKIGRVRCVRRPSRVVPGRSATLRHLPLAS